MKSHHSFTALFRGSQRGLSPVALATFLGMIAASSTEAASYLYWSEIGGHIIRRAELDGSGAVTIMSGANNSFGGIAFDVVNGDLYSGDRTAIFRANLDGSARVNLVPAANQVADVELDLVNNKIYWSEGGGGINAIYRANLDGSGRETLVNEGLSATMEGIALDVAAGRLYFTRNVNVGNDTIRVMNLDGSGQAVLHPLAGATRGPFDVDLDRNAGVLYWDEVDAGDSVYKSDLIGGSPQLVATIPTLNNGFYLDAQDQKLYVGALGTGIQGLNADGTGLATVVSVSDSVNYIEVLRVPDISSVPDSSETITLLGLGLATLCGVGCRNPGSRRRNGSPSLPH